MNELPSIVDLTEDANGIGFYLCAKKEERQTRTGGSFLSLTLRDRTGEVRATMFDDIEKFKGEFEEEDFVKIEARARTYQGRLELLVSRIRRVQEADRAQGFSEERCLPVSPRSADEMWQELQDRIAAVRDPGVQSLLRRIVADHGERLRIWPAANAHIGREPTERNLSFYVSDRIPDAIESYCVAWLRGKLEAVVVENNAR